MGFTCKQGESTHSAAMYLGDALWGGHCRSALNI